MPSWRLLDDTRRLGAIVAVVIADALLINALIRVKVQRLEENGLHSKYDMK